MISTTAYILISTILSHGQIMQSTATFADKPSCESAALRQDVILKALDNQSTFWNFTCHPYSLNEIKK